MYMIWIVLFIFTTSIDARPIQNQRLLSPPDPPWFEIENVQKSTGNVSGLFQAVNITCHSSSGQPPPIFQWFIDDQQIDHDLDPIKTIYMNNKPFTSQAMRNIPFAWSDQGKTIKCKLIHDALTITDICEVFININAPFTSIFGQVQSETEYQKFFQQILSKEWKNDSDLLQKNHRVKRISGTYRVPGILVKAGEPLPPPRPGTYRIPGTWVSGSTTTQKPSTTVTTRRAQRKRTRAPASESDSESNSDDDFVQPEKIPKVVQVVQDPEIAATIRKYQDHQCQYGEYFRIYQDLNEPLAENEGTCQTPPNNGKSNSDDSDEEEDDDDGLGLYVPDENDEPGLCHSKVESLFKIYKDFYSSIEERGGEDRNPVIYTSVINAPNPMLNQFYSTSNKNPITIEDFTTISDPEYKCNHCSHTSLRKSRIKTHIKAKHKGKGVNDFTSIRDGSYRCNLCLKPTTRDDSMKCHIKYQHIEKFIRYPCEKCGQKFSREDSKNVHVEIGHVKPPKSNQVFTLLPDGTVGRRDYDPIEDGKVAFGKEMFKIYCANLTKEGSPTKIIVGKTRFTEPSKVVKENIRRIKQNPGKGCSFRHLLKLDDENISEEDKYHVDADNAFFFEEFVAVGRKAADSLKFIFRDILGAEYIYSPREPKELVMKDIIFIKGNIGKEFDNLPEDAQKSFDNWEPNQSKATRGKRSNDDCDDNGDDIEDQNVDERQLYLPEDDLRLCQTKIKNLYDFNKKYTNKINKCATHLKSVVLSSKAMFFKIFESTDGVGVKDTDFTFLRDEETFACDYCNQKSDIEASIKVHIQRRHINNFDKQHECPKCGTRFNEEHNLNEHISKGHVKDLKPKIVYAIGPDGKIHKRPIEPDDGNVNKGKTLFRIVGFKLIKDGSPTELAIGKSRFIYLDTVVDGNINKIKYSPGKGCGIRNLLKLHDKNVKENEKYHVDTKKAFAFDIIIVGEKAANAFKFYFRDILGAFFVVSPPDSQLNVADYDEEIEESVLNVWENLGGKAQDSFREWQNE